MSAPALTTANFLAALQSLLPRGRVWPKAADAVQTAYWQGIAATYETQTERANGLLVDAFPASTYELLPEWEATLGLPDPCAGIAPTIQERRAQVVARFANSGGQSIAFFTQFASDLGFAITISEFAPFRMGQSRMGQQLGNTDWFFTWATNAPLNTETFFRVGQSTMGEPLAIWGNTVLECEFTAVKPAHTILQFRY
jgi:uncharacterized protein YmfQ (DUF2313 family)